MKREYIGRCDICGKNLYEDDVYISVYPIIGAAVTVCCDCSEVNYKWNSFNIIDLVENIERVQDEQ